VRPRSTTTLLLVLAAGVVAACGSDEEGGAPIPADIATQLESRLDEVQRRFEFGGGACTDIANDSQPAVEQLVASVPGDVDRDVRDALRQSFDRLFELTAEQCDEQQGQDTETETEPPPVEEPTETDTTPTDVLPTEPEEEPPVETDPGLPPGQDGEPPGQDGVPPGQDGQNPAQGGDGGAVVPEDDG